MSNMDNLKGHGFHEMPAERQREIQAMGVKAAREKAKQRRQFREEMAELLDMPLNDSALTKKIKSFSDLKGANITVRKAICAQIAKRAIEKKDVRAADLCAILAGEKDQSLNLSGEIPVVIKDDITETD